MDLLFSCQEIDCDGCNICVVKKHIKNSYSESDFESIINSDTMLELFLREVFPEDEPFIKMFDFLKSLREITISNSNINCSHDNVIGFDEGSCDECNLEQRNMGVSEIVITKPPIKKMSYVAKDYKTKVKQMGMMENLFKKLENETLGISKTLFLKSVSKDNKSGRKNFDEIVQTAIVDGVIVKLGRKYYLRKNIMIHENNFHRKVYHIIYDYQPISSSSILTKLNYRNSKGKRKLLQILKLMSEEDLIQYSSSKWIINSN